MALFVAHTFLIAMTDSSWKLIAIIAIGVLILILFLVLAFVAWAARSQPATSQDGNSNAPDAAYNNQKTLAYWNVLIDIENQYFEVDIADDQLFIQQNRFAELATTHNQSADAIRTIANRIIALPTRGVDRELVDFGERRAQWFKDLSDNLDAWGIHYVAVADHNDKYTGILAIAEGAIRGAFGDIFGKRSEVQASLKNLEFDGDRLNELLTRIMSDGEFLTSEREALQLDLFEKYGWNFKE